MNKRIRKKKLKQKIAYIDLLINRNNQIRKEYKTDKSINGFPANLVIPFRNFGLQFNKSILIRSLKRGEY